MTGPSFFYSSTSSTKSYRPPTFETAIFYLSRPPVSSCFFVSFDLAFCFTVFALHFRKQTTRHLRRRVPAEPQDDAFPDTIQSCIAARRRRCLAGLHLFHDCLVQQHLFSGTLVSVLRVCAFSELRPLALYVVIYFSQVITFRLRYISALAHLPYLGQLTATSLSSVFQHSLRITAFSSFPSRDVRLDGRFRR